LFEIAWKDQPVTCTSLEALADLQQLPEIPQLLKDWRLRVANGIKKKKTKAKRGKVSGRRTRSQRAESDDNDGKDDDDDESQVERPFKRQRLGAGLKSLLQQSLLVPTPEPDCEPEQSLRLW
jgi:hypothetical protein